MSVLHELDMPKLAVAAILGIIGFGVGTLTWLSMPEHTSWIVQGLVLLFVLACIMPALSIWLNWRPGLALSVVVALSCVIGLQLTVKKDGLIRATGSQAASTEATLAPDLTQVGPMLCRDGYELQLLHSPHGPRVVLHQAATKKVVFITQGSMNGRMTLKPLSAEMNEIIVSCRDTQGRDFATVYGPISVNNP